jgi:leucyl aminopeptidase (aminopeptidase T)
MISGTLEYLRRPLAANVRRGQKVLFVTDTSQDPRVWQAMMTVAAELGAEATVALFEPRPADYYDPPRSVCAAMLNSDVNVLVASTGMLHSEASSRAMAAGIPSICMDGGMRLEWFQEGGITADYRQIRVFHHYVGMNVFGKSARQVRVTSRYGTDITFGVEGRIFVPKLPGDDFDPYAVFRTSTTDGRPGRELYLAVFPGGEFNIPPVEGTGNGTCVIDLTMHHIGRLHEPISLSVKNGRIVSIDGGADAKILRDYLDTYGDENAHTFPTEASVGLNPKALIRGCQREDKNILGSMHFGLGTNIDVGGQVLSNVHMDGVILEPTVFVDSVEKIRNGRFLVAIGQ